MKGISEYIKEQLEVENGSHGYKVVTLVRRDVDLSSISESDFIDFIIADYKEAVHEYAKIMDTYNENNKKEHIENEVKAAIKYAEKKWKTEKKRNEYVETIRKNAETKQWFMENPEDIHFDLKPSPSQSILQDCIISKKSNKDTLKKAYAEVKKDSYFTHGTGWAFKYETIDADKPYAFRPWIDILLDESDRAEQKRDQQNLDNAVNDYYKDTNYWRD